MCTYDPLDDVTGHLVRYFITSENEPALELSEIRCAEGTCEQTSREPLGPTTHPDGVLVHRADGTRAFIVATASSRPCT